MIRSTYEIVANNEAVVILRDCNTGKSITNDIENVVEDLKEKGIWVTGKRLYYYDTLGNMDEIIINSDGNAIGFAPGRKQTNCT